MNKRFIALIAIIAAVVGFNIYRTIDKVKLEGRYYPKDSKSLNIDAKSKDFSTKKLNKFTELERLSISKVNDDILEDFGDFKELSSLTFFYAKLYKAAPKLNSYEKLEEVSFFNSEVDLQGVYISELKDIVFDKCDVKNFSALKECAKLDHIQLSGTTADGYIVHEDHEYVLKDSSVFADLDTVTNINLEHIVLEDISGILEMDSLKTVVVGMDEVPDETVDKLTSHGIEVWSVSTSID
ncbi:MAG: hypothetical protein IJM38_03265 [Ruminococcus sp.]|nr:hypothetical protein [Ruminococcus sp.]